jgi:hypothetical protein
VVEVSDTEDTAVMARKIGELRVQSNPASPDPEDF